MDEYIELLDSNSKPTGKKCLKSIAHKNGYYHASVHIWLYTKNKEILIQKRKDDKDTFPGLWDASVAGHISFEETPIKSAIREVQEEIGLTINESQLQPIGTSTHKKIHSKNLIDYELHHIYIVELISDFKDLQIQEEEVAEIKLIKIDKFELELQKNPSQYVPHGLDYYARVFNIIQQYFKFI